MSQRDRAQETEPTGAVDNHQVLWFVLTPRPR